MFIKAMRFPGLMMPVLIIAFLCLLSGCGTGGLSDAPSAATGAGTGTGGTTTTPPAAGISLGTDAVTVKSNNSDSATITAIALDSSNAVIEGATISFSATGGAISAASAKTDASGQAVIKFSSGTLDQSNQVVTITATASGKTAQIPVQVVGSTLTMSEPATLPSDGSATATLTVLAKNAGDVPVRNVNVTLTVSGAGNVAFSATSGTTDLNGKLRDAAGNEVTVSGTLAGTATATATGMGTTASLDYTVTGPAVGVFSITSPTADPASCSTASTIDVEVTVPNVTATPNVTFATTLGLWDGTAAVKNVAVNPVTKKAKATLSSTLAGFATVQAYDPLVPATTDSMGVAFYAPATAAAQISLQSDVSVLGLSTGGVSKTTTLKAKVRTAGGVAPVGNAPVAFSIADPTGGGESISPVVAYTDASGLATATFTSGSASSGATGVKINAQVVGSTPAVTAPQISIVIGGTAGSVVIGLGSKITVLNTTTYSLPMSVLVADSSGSAVPGAAVSLNLWPVQYSSGVWYNSIDYDPDNPTKVLYKSYVTGTFDNDDVNEDTIKGAAEKSDPYGALRPPNSAAGDLPATVTTDANGVANFNLIYLKGSAAWIRDRIRASTLVLGTETNSSITFTLPAERTEAEAGELPNATYPVDLTVTATAGSTVTYTMPAWNSDYVVAPATPTYSTSSIYSTITTAPPTGTPPVYTFTAPAGVTAGTVYHDFVTASDGGTTSATSWIRIVAR
jgi:hypothetical protein